MKKLIVLTFAITSFLTVYPQLPPNVVEGRYYRFISRSAEDTTKAIELTVVYDKQGNATITRQIMPAIHDGFNSYLIGIKGDLVTTANDDDLNIIYFQSSQKKYLLPFDDPKKQYTLLQDTLTLICNCGEEKSNCKSDYFFGFGGVYLDIAFANNTCRTYTTFKAKEPVTIEGGFLVVRANSISIK